ncbi:MAG TPA: peptide ABC transporter substrate-binding protein [Ktedonobacteraceae bacterium]|nr:peptide ABC transporter substrate-binding protein [Ktedonobacteraceae bacterium]
MNRPRANLKHTWFILLFLLVISMTACTSINTGSNSFGSTQKAPDAEQVFTYPIAGVNDIVSLDPAITPDLPSTQAITALFTGLVQLDDNLNIVPQMASSWSVSDDRQTWTFHLRPNLKFSDGTPITSHTVAFSIDRALRQDTASPTAPTYLGLIKDAMQLYTGKAKTIIGDSLLLPNDQTIVIITSQAAAYFLDALTYPSSFVVEPSLVQKYGAKFVDHLSEGGSSGPFKLVSYSHTTGLIFAPNPNYYGPIPQIQQLKMPFYKDNTTQFKAYQTNQVDETVIPSNEFSQAKNNPQEFHSVPLQLLRYLSMNYLKPPFNNIKIRQAFALAINKQIITHAIFKDKYIPTNDIVPPGTGAYDNSNITGPDGTKNLSGNKTLARQLLQEGLQEENISSVSKLPVINLLYFSQGKDVNDEMDALAQMWHDVLGIDVKLESVSFAVLLGKLNLTNNNSPSTIDAQMWLLGWAADYPDPQDWLTLQFGPGQQNNSSNYAAKSLAQDVLSRQQITQRLMVRADAEKNVLTRMSDYAKVEQALINDVAWIPLYQQTGTYMIKPYVRGFAYNGISQISPNDWGRIYITQH